jgi:AAA15 family ATPase/GTPase
MHLLKSIELENYLSIKHAKLEDLKDLNIIIGPNNCGKTSLLRAINLLSRIEFARTARAFHCDMCETVFNNDGNVQSARGSLNQREKYLGNTRAKLIYGYHENEIEKIVPEFSKRRNGILAKSASNKPIQKHLEEEFSKEQLLMSEEREGFLSEHISPIIWDQVSRRIFNHIIFCPDERLQNYKENTIQAYVNSKNLTTSVQRRIIEFLKQVVDTRMVDMRQNSDLVRDVENQEFTTSIAEQGSGVKSLVCLMADILSERQTRLVLIDEPELGLNPSGKHAFLEFLLDESNKKQIFMATHDPTFVNPLLWNRKDVSVYLFSVVNNDFVKVDLAQSKQDPNTFAGYLPHTTSLKKVHIYVEGKEDVYIFQIFLNKYLRSRFRYWYRYLNEIGIFHLAGDFWSHLLYTIPKRPYASIVVLDGDKRPIAEQIVSKYSTIERDRFQTFDTLEELSKVSSMKTRFSGPCPVYCLQRSKIEDYLEPKPSSKEAGPLVADKMSKVPKEIEWIFDLTLQLAGIKIQRHQLSED